MKGIDPQQGPTFDAVAIEGHRVERFRFNRRGRAYAECTGGFKYVRMLLGNAKVWWLCGTWR